jgi:serine/threonine protein kinase
MNQVSKRKRDNVGLHRKRLKTERHWTIRSNESNISHGELLGEGGYGQVHKMFDSKTEKCFARKLIRLFAGISTRDIENEIRAVKKLCKNGHPNIVQVFQLGKLEADGGLYFIDMELCDVSLDRYIRGETSPYLVNWTVVREQAIREAKPTEVLWIANQILDGLIFIHKQKEVHRDISPHNSAVLETSN